MEPNLGTLEIKSSGGPFFAPPSTTFSPSLEIVKKGINLFVRTVGVFLHFRTTRVNMSNMGDEDEKSECCPLIGASEFVKQTIETTRANPELLTGESLRFFPRLSYLPLCV